MAMRSVFCATLTLVSIIAAPVTAEPGPAATAEALFREGRRLMDAGDYAQACDAFEGSLRADPAVTTRMNLGNCREKNQQYASAWSHYIEAARAARGVPAQADLARAAQIRADQMEPRLSRLVINVPDEARVDGLVITRGGATIDPAAWNRDLPIDGGTYVVAGKAPGYEPWSTTVKVKAAQDKQSVNVPKLATATIERDDGDEEGEPVDDDGAHVGGMLSTGKRKLALGAWVVGAAGLGAGLAFELKSGSTYDDAQRSLINSERRALTDQSNRERRYAVIATGAGVVAVAAGLYLWLDGAPPSGRREVALVPSLTSDGAAVVVVGSF